MRQVVVYPDPEDGGFVVEVPSLPGCISQGDTIEESLHNVRDAIAAWTEGAAVAGMDVPQKQ